MKEKVKITIEYDGEKKEFTADALAGVIYGIDDNSSAVTLVGETDGPDLIQIHKDITERLIPIIQKKTIICASKDLKNRALKQLKEDLKGTPEFKSIIGAIFEDEDEEAEEDD